MQRIAIHYDGDCPFCARYSRLLNLRQHGEVTLHNLRDDPAARDRFRAEGLDPDRGMIVEIDGRRYGGADAMHVLSVLDRPSGLFTRLIRVLFFTGPLAALAYPVLRAGRNLLLVLVGRDRLTPDPTRDCSRELIVSGLGLFCYLHLLVYFFQYGPESILFTLGLGLVGLWLILRPLSSRGLVLVLTLMTIDAWLQLPNLSNHTLIKNFWLLAMLPAALWHALKGNRINEFLDSLYRVGRWLLLIMYFFGVFHKINSDFLNPVTSCATTLWREMPAWLSWIDAELIGALTTWGTLVIETVIVALLLAPRLRHAGIVLGIGFHSLLALSDYALYATFSMLSLLLHLTFLTRGAAGGIIGSPGWQRWRELRNSWRGVALVAACAGMLWLLAWTGSYSQVGLFWIVLISPLFVLLVRCGGESRPASTWSLLRVRPAFLWMFVALYLFNGFAPYLGLKTAQSINMFANLRVEGGVSNHYLIRKIGPFDYLDDTVRLESAQGSQYFQSVIDEDLALVYYALLDELDRNPGARVDFERGGAFYRGQSAETLAKDIREILHPRWFRKWFNFTKVDLNQPKQCALDR